MNTLAKLNPLNRSFKERALRSPRSVRASRPNWPSSAVSTSPNWPGHGANSPPSNETRKLIQAIKDGVSGLAVKDELVSLEARKAALTTALAEPPLPALHPHMAEVFRQKASALAAGLEHDDRRDAARQALRGFLQSIIIPPGDGLLRVTGNLGAMLEAAAGHKMPGQQAVGNVGCGGGI